MLFKISRLFDQISYEFQPLIHPTKISNNTLYVHRTLSKFIEIMEFLLLHDPL